MMILNDNKAIINNTIKFESNACKILIKLLTKNLIVYSARKRIHKL